MTTTCMCMYDDGNFIVSSIVAIITSYLLIGATTLCDLHLADQYMYCMLYCIKLL